ANATDRRKLADIVSGLLNLRQAPPAGHAALLVPTVQAARDAARRAHKLKDFGLSAAGAQLFVDGLPMSDIDDRQIVPLIVVAALHGALPAQGGRPDQSALDDPAGKEK